MNHNKIRINNSKNLNYRQVKLLKNKKISFKNMI